MGSRSFPTWDFAATNNDGITEIFLSGKISELDIDKIQDDVFEVSSQYNNKLLLVDCRDLIGRYGFVEPYRRVRNYQAKRTHIYTAVVDIPENEEYQRFHEMTALNAGIKLRYFFAVDEARKWLKTRSNIHK